jgi:hypothetical protein
MALFPLTEPEFALVFTREELLWGGGDTGRAGRNNASARLRCPTAEATAARPTGRLAIPARAGHVWSGSDIRADAAPSDHAVW